MHEAKLSSMQSHFKPSQYQQKEEQTSIFNIKAGRHRMFWEASWWLAVFYSISTLVGYLTPNSVFIYIYIYIYIFK